MRISDNVSESDRGADLTSSAEYFVYYNKYIPKLTSNKRNSEGHAGSIRADENGIERERVDNQQGSSNTHKECQKMRGLEKLDVDLIVAIATINPTWSDCTTPICSTRRKVVALRFCVFNSKLNFTQSL